MFRKWILPAALLVLFSSLALAQVVTWPPPAGTQAILCVYNTVAPVMTTSQVGFAQCDANGQLKTTGSGGGGGGAATIADGADVAEGATTDAAVAFGGTGTVSAKLRLMTTQLNTLNTSVQAATPAGSAIIGKVGIDQTTMGVTNGVTIVPSSATAIGITPVTSAAAESSHVLKAGPGNVYSVYAANLNATTGGWLVLLNATAAPADGAIVPLACALLSANGMASIQYSPGPPGVFSTGITAVVTSGATCFTKTTGTLTAFISGSVQ